MYSWCQHPRYASIPILFYVLVGLDARTQSVVRLMLLLLLRKK